MNTSTNGALNITPGTRGFQDGLLEGSELDTVSGGGWGGLGFLMLSLGQSPSAITSVTGSMPDTTMSPSQQIRS